jgi:hypothetical protein
MNASRDELIALAAKALDCEGKTAHGHWIYRDPSTGLWMVTDANMEDLGGRVKYATERGGSASEGIESWCHDVPATEVDVDMLTRDYAIGNGDDLETAMEQALVSHRSWSVHGVHPRTAMHYLQLHLLLRFFRQDVVDTIRINAEIDRDHGPDGPDWDEDNSFDWSDDGEATR